jgi:hypothetical protein
LFLMKVLIEAIKFNHDPLMASADAINIRKNETETVPVPEWERPLTNAPAAYAISETRGNTITIQARFSCVPPVSSLEIRAIDPTRNPILSDVEDFLDEVFAWLGPIPRILTNNVLGTVKSRQVVFNEQGESDFARFELENLRIQDVGVSVSTTRWQWQYRLNATSPWTDFDTTDHRIYTVLSIPREPWSQSPATMNNTELPWTEVLELACTWASGAKTPDEAAVGVTRGMRTLEQTTSVVYDFGPYYSYPHFDCTAFLNLASGGPGRGLHVNCDDCATVVSSFANILGCELWQSDMLPGVGLGFYTNPIRLFGRTNWEPVEFGHHEVAWEGACSENEDVYDACVEVDGDDEPTIAPPQTPLLPANLRFGRSEERAYVFRLSPPPTPSTARPRPSLNRVRRAIQSNPDKPAPRVRGRYLRIIKERYSYKEWNKTPLEGLAIFPAVRASFPVEFQDWKLSVKLFESSNLPPAFSALLQNKPEPSLLMRIDVDVCASERDMPHFLLQTLGQFDSLRFKRRTDLGIGSITFVDAETGAILFGRGNLIILVRSAARGSLPLETIALHIDRFVGPHPPDGESTFADFSLPDRIFHVGEKIPLTHTESISYVACKFLTSAGCVERRRYGAAFTYEPRVAGHQEMSIVGFGADGTAYQQRLLLHVKERPKGF